MTEKVDFLPQDIRKNKVLGKRLNLAILVTFTLMICVVGSGWSLHRKNVSIDTELVSLRESVESMQTLELEVGPLKSDLEMATKKHLMVGGLTQRSNWASASTVQASYMRVQSGSPGSRFCTQPVLRTSRGLRTSSDPFLPAMRGPWRADAEI